MRHTFPFILWGLLFLSACSVVPSKVNTHLSPASVTVAPGEMRLFTVPSTGVRWGDVGWHATGGTVIGTGSTAAFFAPLEVGTYSVTATRLGSRHLQAEATVVVEGMNAKPSPLAKAPYIYELHIDELPYQ